MAAIPPQFQKRAPGNNTDPNGPDAQDQRVGNMHKGAHQANKAQRNLTHAAGKKGK